MPIIVDGEPYEALAGNIGALLTRARRGAVRAINAILTATYWEIGRYVVEFQQQGEPRAEYGKELLKQLSEDLTTDFGRGFSVDNLELMRQFYLCYSLEDAAETAENDLSEKSETPSRKLVEGPENDLSEKSETLSRKLEESAENKVLEKSETPSRIFELDELAECFPLSWSHYSLLVKRCQNQDERDFYESEALKGGWSVRQLDRQVSSQFYQRLLLSRKKALLLQKEKPEQEDSLSLFQQEIKDPFVLEFLDLKDQYSETEFEEALIQHLEHFILEMGWDFCFVGRQRRLRIGGVWYRVDLIFYHRRLRCLVLIDLKIGQFTHADAGQMQMYLNYARENWTSKEENRPVGIVLCSQANSALAHYALGESPTAVLTPEYELNLPDKELLVAELKRGRALVERRHLLLRARRRRVTPTAF